MQCALRLGFHTIYLADLDAIAGLPPRFDVYRELIAARFHLWIDAGVRDPGTVAPLLELDPDFTTIVAGLETMAGRRELDRIPCGSWERTGSCSVSTYSRNALGRPRRRTGGRRFFRAGSSGD